MAVFPGDRRARPPRADPGLTLFPFILSSSFLSHTVSSVRPLLRAVRRGIRRPAGLATIAAAAAIVATIVGVLASVSPSADAVGAPAGGGQASAASTGPDAMYGVGSAQGVQRAAHAVAARQSGRGAEVRPADRKAAAHKAAPQKKAQQKKAQPAKAQKAQSKKAQPKKAQPKKAQHAAKKAAHQKPRHAAPARKPFLIYDSVTPSSIPTHRMVAAYATGNYAASAAQVAGRKVMWIDTTGSDYAASALDVEPGDATPTLAATWAQHRLDGHPHSLAVIYTMRSEWSAVKAAVNALPSHLRVRVRWWIADPTGSPHIVPGASATQWYWGTHYDITTAAPGF